jgi:hypothetical protein
MKVTKHNYRVDRKDISYLRWIVESYDGMAFLKTIDPYEAFIEIEVSPGCEAIFFELVESLKMHEHLKISMIEDLNDLHDQR